MLLRLPNNRYARLALLLLASLATVGTLYLLVQLSAALGSKLGTSYASWRYRSDTIPYRSQPLDFLTVSPHEATTYDVVQEIARQAERADFPILTALEVLGCESGYLYNARNQNSSALGVAQWLTGTWKQVAPEGADRLDYKLSIALFIEYYNKYPQWWAECN